MVKATASIFSFCIVSGIAAVQLCPGYMYHTCNMYPNDSECLFDSTGGGSGGFHLFHFFLFNFVFDSPLWVDTTKTFDDIETTAGQTLKEVVSQPGFSRQFFRQMFIVFNCFN